METKEARLSIRTLLHINLGIGVLTALSNGAALFVTMTGRAEQLVGKELEIVIWLSLGLMLVCASLLGLAWNRNQLTIVKLQSVLIALLAVLLALWGLTLVFGRLPESRTIWSFGYLSAVTIYAVYVMGRAFGEPKYSALRFYLRVAFLPIGVLVDAATFARVSGLI